MLYLIGLGLGSDKDISLRAQEALNKCSDIYIEEYTGKYPGKSNDLLKKAKKLTREQVESDFLVNKAKSADIALLVIGDP